MLEEEKDDVKRMNQMMLYSQCVAVRSTPSAVRKLFDQELSHYLLSQSSCADRFEVVSHSPPETCGIA